MNWIGFFNLTSVLIVLILLGNIHIRIKNIEKFLEYMFLSDADTTQFSVEEEEEAFDNRIAMLKDEIASHTADANLRNEQDYSETNPAVPLHPLITNLPHNSIKNIYNTLPDVEYTE